MYIILKRSFVVMLGTATLVSCGETPKSDVQVNKQLTVWGPQRGVGRFAALQYSRRPVLQTSAPAAVGSGNQQIVVSLPPNFSGEEVVHITREALAAGLNYKFEDRRRTNRSAS